MLLGLIELFGARYILLGFPRRHAFIVMIAFPHRLAAWPVRRKGDEKV